MNKLTFAQWYGSVGPLRVSLLIVAIFGKVLLYIFNPPYYMSRGTLIRPFPFLFAMDMGGVVVGSVIIVECIRMITYPSTSSWSLKRHFVIVFALIVALAIFKVFIISPKKSKHYHNYGWSLSEKKDYMQAILSLDIAVKYNSKNIKAYLERAYNYRRMGNFDAALRDCNKVIDVSPNYADAYACRGYTYYCLGDSEKALNDLNKAISIDPQIAKQLDKWIEAIKNQ